MRTTGASTLVLVVVCMFGALLGTVATNFDFRAFYCAASIAQQRGDPYTVEPLHGCEQALPNDPFAPYSKATALPAPLPGYAFVFLAPLAQLSFPLAARLWTLCLALATLVATVAIMRLTALPASVVASAFLLSLCATSLGLGELVPIFIAAICVAALFAQREAWIACSAATAVAMIEPHLAIPVVLALAVWERRTRLPLAIVCCTLCALSVAIVGVRANLQYVFDVLPAHATSELGSDSQLSLAVMLHWMGASAHTAIAAGAASYLVSSLGGIAFAGVLARRFRTKAFVVLTPAAFSLAGGTFVHVTQMAAALPFVLLLLVRTPRYRSAVLVSCLLLAIPWRIVGGPPLVTTAVLVAFYLAWEMSERALTAGAVSAAGAIILMMALNVWMSAPAMQRHDSYYAAPINSNLAEASWERYNEQYLSTGTPERWMRRAPTWAGLLLLTGTVVLLALPKVRDSKRDPVAYTTASRFSKSGHPSLSPYGAERCD